MKPMAVVLAMSLLSGFPYGLNAQTDSLVDVFPLAIGNQWTYRYFTLMYYWPTGNPVETRTDSGRVTYDVLGRIVSLDSTQWQFRLTRDLTRHQILYYPISLDTIFSIRDTSLFEIIENHQGQHQLYRNADPYAIHLDVFPFTKAFTDTTRIYRFRRVGLGDTVAFRSAISPHTRSTFTFKRSVGLHRFRFNSGTMDVFDTLHHYLISNVITSAQSPIRNNQPGEFTLCQNYPNPFNPSTTIEYAIPTSGFVSIKVFDVLGREVATLLENETEAGSHFIDFHAEGLASGVYYYQLRSRGFQTSRKFHLLR